MFLHGGLLLVFSIAYGFLGFVHQTLSPSITNVQNAIDKSLAERDSNIVKFCSHLDKDINELGKEVKEVKQESQVDDLLFLMVTVSLSVMSVFISSTRTA